jgi:hypothetical protein
MMPNVRFKRRSKPWSTLRRVVDDGVFMVTDAIEIGDENVRIRAHHSG